MDESLLNKIQDIKRLTISILNIFEGSHAWLYVIELKISFTFHH